MKDLIKPAGHADLSEFEAKEIIEQVQQALSEWKVLAKNYGVLTGNMNLISGKIN